MTQYVGRGDAAKTMALLWGDQQPNRRGPKQGLDVEGIVAAAIAIADAEGLDNLSMRRVAEALGVSTMSLYTYVPGKAELLEVMVDRVVGEQSLPQADAGPGWRAGLETYARTTWDLYRRHPWLLGVATSRTVFGPHVIARFDAALGLLDGIGLSPRQVVAAVGAIEGYIRGAAQAVTEAERATVGTGQTDDEWWASRAPLLDERLAAGSYPNLMALSAAGAFDQEQWSRDYTVQRAIDEFDFGLGRILDGLDALVERST